MLCYPSAGRGRLGFLRCRGPFSGKRPSLPDLTVRAVRPPATVRASGATRETAKRLHGVTPTRPRPSRLSSGRAPGVRRGSVSAAKAADATSQPRGGRGASSQGVACPRRDRFHAHEATAITPDAGGSDATPPVTVHGKNACASSPASKRDAGNRGAGRQP